MTPCEECISRIDSYLHDELRNGGLETVENHIKGCPSCRREFAERRRFFEHIRAARPLYVPSPKFRAEMAALLAEPSAAPASSPERPRQASKRRSPLWFLPLDSKLIPAFIACALAIAAIVTLWTVSIRDARANAFVDMAVQTHRQQLARNLPLEVTTNSPREVSAWFARKVPFNFRLPMSQETPDQPQRYKLAGGRLVNFKGTYAAYIAYRMQGQLISLIVTSASTSEAWGGEETVSKSLTFHTHSKQEVQVVTWSAHNVTYALVSGVNVPPGQSCAVCHASTKERDLIDGFRSTNKQRTRGNNIDAHVFLTLCDENDHRKKL